MQSVFGKWAVIKKTFKTAHGHLVHSYRSLQNNQRWCQLWAVYGTPCSQTNIGLFKLLAVYHQKVEIQNSQKKKKKTRGFQLLEVRKKIVKISIFIYMVFIV